MAYPNRAIITVDPITDEVREYSSVNELCSEYDDSGANVARCAKLGNLFNGLYVFYKDPNLRKEAFDSATEIKTTYKPAVARKKNAIAAYIRAYNRIEDM